jgi:hypothetical protein
MDKDGDYKVTEGEANNYLEIMSLCGYGVEKIHPAAIIQPIYSPIFKFKILKKGSS